MSFESWLAYFRSSDFRSRIHTLRDWLPSLRPPNYTQDPNFQSEADWADHVDAGGLPSDWVLDYARAKWQETLDTFQQLNAWANQLLTTAGALATVVTTAIAALKVQPTWSLLFALFSFLLAMVAVVWSRQPADHPLLPRVRDLLDMGRNVSDREVWLAASIHRVVEASRPLSLWKAKWVKLATYLLCAGVGFLFSYAVIIWFAAA